MGKFGYEMEAQGRCKVKMVKKILWINEWIYF